MAHEVEKVLCKGCGVQYPEDCTEDGLCESCYGQVDVTPGEPPPPTCGMCGTPFTPEGDGMLRDSFIQACKCPPKLVMEAALAPPRPVTLPCGRCGGTFPADIILASWVGECGPCEELSSQEALEHVARAKARAEASWARERVALERAEAREIRQLRNYLSGRIRWSSIIWWESGGSVERLYSATVATQRRAGRAKDVADMRAIVATLRLIRKRRAELDPGAPPSDDVVDGLLMAWPKGNG